MSVSAAARRLGYKNPFAAVQADVLGLAGRVHAYPDAKWAAFA